MSRRYRANAISGIFGKKGKYTKQQLKELMREEESPKNREHSIQERRKRRKQAAKRAGN